MDFAIHGGADVDGDLVCTIHNPTMRRGRIPGLPILYESRKAEKKTVDLRNDEEQVAGQLVGYDSKVGFATNISSSLYCMLEEFSVDSEEYNTIQKQWYKYGEVDWVLMASILDEYKYRWFPDLAHLVAATSRLSLSKKVEIDNLLVEDEFMNKIFSHLESYYRRED